MPDRAGQPVVPIQDDANGAFLRPLREERGDLRDILRRAGVGQPEKNILKRQYISLSDSTKYARRPPRVCLSSGSTLNSGGSSVRKQAELAGLESTGALGEPLAVTLKRNIIV